MVIAAMLRLPGIDHHDIDVFKIVHVSCCQRMHSAAAASSNATMRNGVQPVYDTLQRLGSHKLRDDVRVQNGHRVSLKFSRASWPFRSLCDLELYAPGRQEPLVNCRSQSTTFPPGLLHRLGEDPTCLFLHRTVVPRCPKPQPGLYAIIKISNRNRRHDFVDSNDYTLHLTCQTDRSRAPRVEVTTCPTERGWFRLARRVKVRWVKARWAEPRGRLFGPARPAWNRR